MSIFTYPFVRLALALMAGQCLADFCPQSLGILFVLWLAFLPIRLLMRRKCLWLNASMYWVLGLFALLQMWRFSAAQAYEFPDEERCYAAVLLASPKEKPRSRQCQARLLLPECQGLPKGSTLPKGLSLPKGSTLPKGLSLPKGSTLPKGSVLMKWLMPPKWLLPQCKIQLYLPKDERSASLQMGDVLYFRANLSPDENAFTVEALPDSLVAGHWRRPADFDYQAFLRKQGIMASVFLPNEHWESGSLQTRMPLRRTLQQWRARLVTRYETAGITGDALSLISALTLGQQELMQDEQRETFAAAGVSHILAVSGMHVGIVSQLLTLLLFWLRGPRCFQVLKYLLLIVILWLYAFLTGFSPSVLRAVLMFTVSAMALCLGRKSYTWNSLGFAAVVMLWSWPWYLYQVGFQLSFLAVMSILLLQNYFQQAFSLSQSSSLQAMMTGEAMMRVEALMSDEAFSSEPPFGKSGTATIVMRLRLALWRYLRQAVHYMKELFCLSLAAQIGTAPLSVYYFHQFSNYFWLSNLLMVPLSVLMTYLGVFLLIFADLAVLSHALSFLLNVSLKVFMRLSDWIESLPLSLDNHLYPMWFEVGLLYLMLFALFRLFRSKKVHYYIDYLSLRSARIIFVTK